MAKSIKTKQVEKYTSGTNINLKGQSITHDGYKVRYGHRLAFVDVIDYRGRTTVEVRVGTYERRRTLCFKSIAKAKEFFSENEHIKDYKYINWGIDEILKNHKSKKTNKEVI